ncbi:MAG: poly-gamma-glutamate hydrolase family protein [Deltaproteobacteria bacterium]
MVRVYKSFGELSEREREGQDYRIDTCFRDKRVLVMAPHGGQIEPGTTEIAEAIARDDFSFYSFEGIKLRGNGVLHIESHLFDEPRALEMVEKTDSVVSVHGQADTIDEFVMVGGLNTDFRSEIERELGRSGFRTLEPSGGLMAIDPRNICNRGRSGKGVQLEISRRLRDSLRIDEDLLRKFADAVRRGVRLYLEQVDPS